MKFVDLSLPDVAANLALDEALLDEAVSSDDEFFRLWESELPAVIIGRASKIVTCGALGLLFASSTAAHRPTGQ